MSRIYHYCVSRHVAATPATVFDVVSDHTAMPRWTPFRRAILERPGQPHPNGVGAVRSLHLFGPPTREEVLEFEPPQRLRYRLLSGLPFPDYVGEITIEPEGIGTRLSTDLRLATRIPGTQVFGPLAIRIATRAAARGAEKRASPGEQSGVLVFDGKCGMCTRVRNGLLRLNRTGRLRTEPMQKPGIPERVGVGPERLPESVWWLDSSGAVFSGAEAMNAAVSAALGTPLPLRVYHVPGIGAAQRVVYRWVATHRHRFRGVTPLCDSDPQQCVSPAFSPTDPQTS